MNCKPGDLAIIKGTLFNDGKIVSCIKFVGQDPDLPDYTDLWEVDPPVDTFMIRADDIELKPIGKTIPTSFVPDKHLFPLKGDILENEVIDELLMTEF